MFDDFIERWRLIPEGEAIFTSTSRLLPVRADGRTAMLKITTLDEERRGGALMEWWNGDGAALVLARADGALLMERAEGSGSLTRLVHDGNDDEADRILCSATAKLHAPRPQPPPALIPLAHWFKPLMNIAAVEGGVLSVAAEAAAKLLDFPREITVLHGDIHHANVLDFGPRGWLAIDPKGLLGERCFDYANLFCNPDRATAAEPNRFRRRLGLVAEAAHLSRGRLLAWVLAWAGLSAAFQMEDALPADGELALVERAIQEMDR